MRLYDVEQGGQDDLLDSGQDDKQSIHLAQEKSLMDLNMKITREQALYGAKDFPDYFDRLESIADYMRDQKLNGLMKCLLVYRHGIQKWICLITLICTRRYEY